ncbi:MAG: hypothetical protein HYX28_04240 [Candidatus Koribacter versatilis]|uniref:Uncharacterized protein n=1 Tax=Candidatus Korobacter versatilis TaxID=658062 RepID=A0A932ENQ8_9BACT|nr:hypothetical protein [Candidatus Koribacter versatilis]
MKWTAFDQETAATLSAHVSDVELAQAGADELDRALNTATGGASPAAVVAPAADRDHALLITMRAKDPNAATDGEPTPEPISYQAGGFLGLADEPVFDDKKKKQLPPKQKPR